MRTCDISDCERIHSAKGYCNMHYLRIVRDGGRIVGDLYTWNRLPLKDRMLLYIDEEDYSQCWEWRGSLDSRGRGRLQYKYRSKYAYRVVYEHFIEEIGENMTLDHLCENPSCVNPFHLEQVTRGENMSRYRRNREYEKKRNRLT